MDRNNGKTVEHLFSLILTVVGGVIIGKKKKIWDKKQNS